ERDFGRVLAGVRDRQTGEPGEGREASERTARRTAEEFVASSLVLPVLKALREQNNAAAPFAPGAGEKMFGPLLDDEIAVRISQAQRFPLVDRLARDLLKQTDTLPPEPPQHGAIPSAQ
ncbi:MAG TPA: hypothetical protein DEB06_03185, partial [Phycisphaerales bacterium]|nr:hypothetical protein [Phycisphaerales bacterium]